MLVILLCAFTLSIFHRRSGAEALIAEAARRVRGRRAEAVQLNGGIGGAYAIDRAALQPKLLIDFSVPESTRALIISGAGATKLNCPPGYPLSPAGICERTGPDGSRERIRGTWVYSYQGEPFELPGGWRVSVAPGALPRGVSLISNAKLTERLEFGTNGRLEPEKPDLVGPAESWAIYFTDGRQCRALLISEDGFVEICRWEDGRWTGYEGRIIP